MTDGLNMGRKPLAARNANLEILRIIAAFGIIAFHAQVPDKDVPYAGLIVFLALSPLVDARFNWTRTRPVSNLAKVLLVPWTFWFAIYAAANVVMHKPALPEGHSVGSVLYGSAPHLWFLPFIFIVLVALGLIKRACTAPQVFWFSVIATSTILTAAILWRPPSINVAVPYAQWLHAAAAIFAGLALGLYSRAIRFAWAGIAVMSASLLACVSYDLIGMSVTYAVGLVAVAAAVFAPQLFAGHERAIRSVSQCMFGVYLVHILAIAIVKKVVPVDNYATALAIFALCLAGVALTRRIIPQSKLVLA